MSSPIARIGDKHDCPAHGPNAIITGSSQMMDGKPIATVGSACACGATIVSSPTSASIDGKSIAVIGATTSHGGTITSGGSGKA